MLVGHFGTLRWKLEDSGMVLIPLSSSNISSFTLLRSHAATKVSGILFSRPAIEGSTWWMMNLRCIHSKYQPMNLGD